MKRSNQSVRRNICLLALALTAGLLVQNQACAQRRGGGGGQQAGGGMQKFGGGNNNGGMRLGGGVKSGGMQPLGGGNRAFSGSPQKFQSNSGFGNASGLAGSLQQGTRQPAIKKAGNSFQFGGSQLSSATLSPNGRNKFLTGPNSTNGNSSFGKFQPGNAIGNSTRFAEGIRQKLTPGALGGSNLPGNANFGKSGPPNPLTNQNWQRLQQQWCHQPSQVLLSQCNHVRQNAHLHWQFNTWCGYYPTRCHWWYNWCGSKWYFDPTCAVTYRWYYYPCTVRTGVAVRQFSWHLGLNCVFIPGRGLGIQEVEAGSPAALAGLTEGMVIVAANGTELTDEGLMQGIIEGSSGLLNLTVLPQADAELADVTVQMARIAVRNF